YVPDAARVLDIGCHDGELFRRLGPRLAHGIGVDPALERPVETPTWTLVRGLFPDDVPDAGPFDAVTLLAVLEHVPLDAQAPLAAAIAGRLAPGGRVIVTVPSPLVDHILKVMVALRIADGIAHEEHYGFEPRLVE